MFLLPKSSFGEHIFIGNVVSHIIMGHMASHALEKCFENPKQFGIPKPSFVQHKMVA